MKMAPAGKFKNEDVPKGAALIVANGDFSTEKALLGPQNGKDANGYLDNKPVAVYVSGDAQIGIIYSGKLYVRGNLSVDESMADTRVGQNLTLRMQNGPDNPIAYVGGNAEVGGGNLEVKAKGAVWSWSDVTDHHTIEAPLVFVRSSGKWLTADSTQLCTDLPEFNPKLNLAIDFKNPDAIKKACQDFKGVLASVKQNAGGASQTEVPICRNREALTRDRVRAECRYQ